MKSTTFYLSAVALASAALAQPHRHHNHARFHQAHARDAANKPVVAAPAVQKRDLVTDWVTTWVTETVTEYYDVTATSTIITASESPATTTTPAAVPKSSTSLAAQFFEPSSKSAPAPVAPSPSTPVQDVKPAAQSTQAPTPPPAEVKPAPEPTTAAPVVVQSVAPAPVVSSPAPVVEKPAPAPVSSPATGSGSSSGGGGSGSGGGSSYSGEVTHYTVGLGACGFDDAGKDRSAYIVALSHNLMTSGSWPDAQCGKKVTLSYNGKSITAEVRDKCPSCSPSQIDVSEKAFLDLFGDLGIGRARGVSWTLS
ncbi:hypothetical protein RB595_002745 [Gaeumannomyces hyphopodioides]